MAIAPVTVGGDFRVGEVFSRAWSVLTANLLFFIGISVLIYVAIIVLAVVAVAIAFAAGQVGPGHFGPLLFVLLIAAALLAGIVNVVGEAALLFGAFQYLRGMPVRVGESLSRAMARIGPLIGLTILIALALMIGFILLVVPFFILVSMWAVVVPVCVVEGLGATASMSRSAELTEGHRWKVFGILALLIIINWGSTKILELVLTPVNQLLASLAVLILATLITAYGHCVVIMMYHDLRVAKEGVDISQIASVFD